MNLLEGFVKSLKKLKETWITPPNEPEQGFVHMRTPKNRMELRADFNNYDDLIRAVKAIKEEARILYKEKFREEDFT